MILLSLLSVFIDRIYTVGAMDVSDYSTNCTVVLFFE